MITMRALTCPCCDQQMAYIGSGTYSEHFCKACDFTYFATDASVSADLYEGSEKYQDYYTGTPPSLWYHKQTLRILNSMKEPKQILDFGCYDGFFVRSMRNMGLNAYGCDWNPSAIRRGQEIFDLEDRLSVNPDRVYNIILALEVIEHFSDPREFFDVIAPHLAPDGMIILSCPNKNALYRPGTDYPPHHFSRFSPNSLRTLVERHAFTTIEQWEEMSTFQLLRNYIGDRIRKQHTFQDAESGTTPSQSKQYQILRRAANAGSGIARAGLLPVDALLHAAGKRYLAQMIWARRV